MYAIVETGGKQYRVSPGDTIAVERLTGEPGETLDLERVLLVGGDGSETRVGAPGVADAVVRAEVVEHARGEKIIVFRYKSKVRYRRKTGHRQALTRLRITDILLGGTSVQPARAAEPIPKAAPAAKRTAEPAEPAAEPAQSAATATPRRRRASPATAAEAETEPMVEVELPATAAEAGPAPAAEAEAEATKE
ncbi:MAG TPA: 50S ribosomal protein L21 [Chloroflexota bacterium]|jgi:large subunit ribosomal protein L21